MHDQNVETKSNYCFLLGDQKYGDHVQHNQCTSSESVNLAASAEPVDLDEDYSIQTADAEPTLAKRRKLMKDHQGNSIVKLQCKFII